jgi:hypothetical protein
MTRAELLDMASMKLAEVVLLLMEAGEKRLAQEVGELAEQVEFSALPFDCKVRSPPPLIKMFASLAGLVNVGALPHLTCTQMQGLCGWAAQSKTSLFVISIFTDPGLMPVEALPVPYSMNCARPDRPRNSAALRTFSS